MFRLIKSIFLLDISLIKFFSSSNVIEQYAHCSCVKIMSGLRDFNFSTLTSNREIDCEIKLIVSLLISSFVIFFLL